MKKKVLTLLLALISFMGFSQAKVEIGLKAGANFANTDAGDIDTENITSFNGGLFTLVKLANIGIQPEVLWSKQGSDINVGSVNDELDLNYHFVTLFDHEKPSFDQVVESMNFKLNTTSLDITKPLWYEQQTLV